ncbi:MAG: DNA gyrase inhibitor YacG [Candidatus Kuenenia sp.]|nr:DNA gyrase inhibitor YacG [Candidatus Kuenenia hertensis]
MPKVNCPNCRKILFYRVIKDLPYFPFCSDRCKLIDFGAWMDEEYRIEEDIGNDGAKCIDEKGEGNDG